MPDHQPERLHLMVVDEGEFGHSVTSPQLPGFVYGRPGAAVDMDDLRGALAFAGAPDLPVVVHVARRFTTPTGIEFSIRVAQDRRNAERQELATRLQSYLETGDGLDLLDRAPAPFGEVQLVCVLPEDKVGWMTEQLDDRQDVNVLVAPIADELVWSLPVMSGSVIPIGWARLNLPAEAPIADLIRTQTSRADAGVLVGAA